MGGGKIKVKHKGVISELTYDKENNIRGKIRCWSGNNNPEEKLYLGPYTINVNLKYNYYSIQTYIQTEARQWCNNISFPNNYTNDTDSEINLHTLYNFSHAGYYNNYGHLIYELNLSTESIILKSYFYCITDDAIRNNQNVSESLKDYFLNTSNNYFKFKMHDNYLDYVDVFYKNTPQNDTSAFYNLKFNDIINEDVVLKVKEKYRNYDNTNYYSKLFLNDNNELITYFNYIYCSGTMIGNPGKKATDFNNSVCTKLDVGYTLNALGIDKAIKTFHICPTTTTTSSKVYYKNFDELFKYYDDVILNETPM